MMLIQTVMQGGKSYPKMQNCAVEKVVELSSEDYAAFSSHPDHEYEFIRENTDAMYRDRHGIYHCLLVLGKGQRDGILVDAWSAGFARHFSYLPEARRIWELEQHPSLGVLCDKMAQLAEKYAKQAVECQRNGKFCIECRTIDSRIDFEHYSECLLVEMLSERPELELVEDIGDEIAMFIAPEYIRQEDESQYCKPTPQEVEIMCAKHILWLNDAGGEQADFSGCLLKDMDLSRRNLSNAIFTEAKFVNTDLRHTELCFAECDGARFHDCDLSDVTAEEAQFKEAVFLSCKIHRGTFTHSNLSGAKFRDCAMSSGSLQNCCINGTDFGDMSLSSVKKNGCSYDEQEWIAEQNGSGISM